MANGWISSALLPPEYWWFAFKRAVKVAIYVPFRLNGEMTTPHEIVCGIKPDLRNLLPIFAVSYIRRYKNTDNSKLKNVENHSLAVILVGRSSVSNSPIFFHPHTKKLITSDDFYIDETLPAGPAFGISYAGGIHTSSYSDINVYLKPPTFKPEQEVFVNIRDVHYPATIITVPSKKDSTNSKRNKYLPLTPT